jgi:hypothetical protein
MRRQLLGALGARSLAVVLALVCAATIPFLLTAQQPGDAPLDGPIAGPGGPPPGMPPGDPNAPPNSPANDPPSRAARLALIEGNVTFQPGGVEDWVPATLNRPISTASPGIEIPAMTASH